MTGLAWPAQQRVLTDGTVTLRPFRTSDADAVLRACQDSAIQRWTLVPIPYLREHADQLAGPVFHEEYRRQRSVQFAVTTAGDGADGVVGIKSIDHDHLTAEVGYWLGPWARGRGVASRALAMMSDWAFEVGLLRLEAYVHTDNLASHRVLLNAGYEREGTVRGKFNVRGERPDMALFGRV